MKITYQDTGFFMQALDLKLVEEFDENIRNVETPAYADLLHVDTRKVLLDEK